MVHLIGGPSKHNMSLFDKLLHDVVFQIRLFYPKLSGLRVLFNLRSNIDLQITAACCDWDLLEVLERFFDIDLVATRVQSLDVVLWGYVNTA